MTHSLTAVARNLRELAAVLEGIIEPGPPWIDRVLEMPVNARPFQADFVRNFGTDAFWPRRDLESVIGLTIHHTMSHSPLNTARYCIDIKGYPTIQYHWWVSAGDGCPVYLLADPSWMIWHDCTGAAPTTLAVGMAGSLHLTPPPDEQIGATVQLCRYLMEIFDLSPSQVQGHRERWQLKTQCPGWGPTDRRQRSWGSGWKGAFYRALG